MLEIWLSPSTFHPRKLRHRGGGFPTGHLPLRRCSWNSVPRLLLLRCRVVMRSTSMPRFTPYPPILATTSLKMTIAHTFKNSDLLKQNVALAALSVFLGGKGWLSLGPGFFLTFDASNCKGKIARQMAFSPAPSMPHCSRTHW